MEDGKKMEVQPLAMRSNRVATEIIFALVSYLKKHPELGCVVPESLFLMPSSNNDRRPDVAYISAERFPLADSLVSEGDFPIPPDLAVEFASPTDLSSKVRNKIREYFLNGVLQVWLIYPEEQEIEVYDSPKINRILGAGDTLRTDLLPGFEVTVETLFPKAGNS
jgi:Uma2 family endonuclease